MHTSLAVVHHANQYLITTGYDNREGIEAIAGSEESKSGFTYILRLHERAGIPMNLHLSGTLIEALAWYEPKLLEYVKELAQAGLLELVGSSYGQNIMRFFCPDYNRKQLNEELLLFERHLGIDAREVKVFWPPERVWETRAMAPLLRDARLRNGGYEYVILDDRLLLRRDQDRALYDETNQFDPELYSIHEIKDGIGLLAFPIATRLRRSIPPAKEDDWKQVQSELEGLLVQASGKYEGALVALYADDMEKVAGVGEWGGDGPQRYRDFLDWLSSSSWIKPVRLTEHARQADVCTKRHIELGTFQELANDFDAGEGYERWYLAPDWAPYRGYFTWADGKVKELAADGADASLIELAEKQLLVANWETAWHTPSAGPHGDPSQHGHASPWARALTSHSRHAAVTAEAAHWMSHKDAACYAISADIDNDGELEWIVKNQHIFAVLSARWGGRIVTLFSVAGAGGTMVVGNPCDDWNWMEELNRFMDVPRNHPGAFADTNFENDRYSVEVIEAGPQRVHLSLTNCEPESQAFGLVKEYELTDRASCLFVRYTLPAGLDSLNFECGLSPDYLCLLRNGIGDLSQIRTPRIRGCKTSRVAVWLKPVSGLRWDESHNIFGHGCSLRLQSTEREAALALGVTARRTSPGDRPVKRKDTTVAGTWR
jgi:hypothetical protein